MLVWRFFCRRLSVHLAIVALLSSAIVVLAMYGAYLMRQSQLLSARLEPRVSEGFVLVIEGVPRSPATLPPFRGMHEPPVVLMNSWTKEVLPTSLGNMLVVTANHPDIPGFSLKPQEVSVPLSFKEVYNLEVGSSLWVQLPRGAMSHQVVHFHDGKLFSESLVTASGSGVLATHFLYQSRTTETLVEVLRYLRRVYPSSRMEDRTTTNMLAADITRASYSPGTRAKGELTAFVTIAYLSTTLLGFLDRRKVLAILKSMGLKSGELMKIIAGENALAPLAAAIIGSGTGYGVLWWLWRLGLLSRPDIFVVVGAVIAIVPAVIIGIAVPVRFAQQASVNQLLFERPIPLMYDQVKGLHRRYPALEPHMEKGMQFVKLDVVDGEFPGFIFRKLGNSVKAGEVMAVMYDWGGLRMREYVAPVGGQIVFYQPEAGFIGIRPLGAGQEGTGEGSSDLH